MVIIFVGLVRTHVSYAVELRANARPSDNQLVVEGELVRPGSRSAGLAGLIIGELKAAMTKCRQVFVDRHPQRIGFSGSY